MELKLDINFYESPLNSQDMDWLIYIWHMSRKSCGVDAKIKMDNVPRKLTETMVYHHFFERLTYYRDTEHIIVDFEEWEEENT